MTDTSRRDFLRKASFGAVAVGAVVTVPEFDVRAWPGSGPARFPPSRCGIQALTWRPQLGGGVPRICR